MAPLHWQEHHEKKSEISKPTNINIWFGVAMGLSGIISGSVIALFLR